MEDHTLRVLEFDKIISRLEDQAACALGREVCALAYPAADLESARRKQKETSEARAILDFEGNIPLGGIEDIRLAVEHAELGAMLQPRDLISVQYTLHSCARLGDFLKKLKPKYEIMGELGGDMERFTALEHEITRSVSQSYEVMDSASSALARARSELRAAQSRLIEKMNSYLQSSDYRTIIQEPVVTIRSDRYCIPIKAEHRGQFPGIVHDASASGATVFVEPAGVVELGNRRKELAVKEREEVEKVLLKLSRLVGEHSERIRATLNVVGLIDGIVARAKLSIAMDGSEPRLNDTGLVRLIQARHPLLTGSVVPIDVTIGSDFNVLLITGPNTGGKTVALKTAGLLCLMAAGGMHIPATPNSEIAVFTSIFADIGDEQSIEQSLSTFSSHLNNIVRITAGVSSSSLVLLDEIGAGTDPGEGAALAKAVLDYLRGRGARVIATTHYGELKEFAYLTDGIENASVEFDLESLRPTYRLLIGIPGSSNAFAIASRLGLDDKIIAEARANLATHSEVTEELIRRIEESHRVAMEERRAAQKNASSAEALRRRYEDGLARLDHARDRVESKVRDRAESIIETYAKKLDRTLEQLAAQKADTKASADLKRKAENLMEQLEEKLAIPDAPETKDEKFPPGTPLARGTRVRIAGVDRDGEIVEPPDDGKVVVMMGLMKVTVPISQLRRPRGGPEPAPPPRSEERALVFEKARSFSPEISLRAKRVEPALLELDKYLDDAMAAGIDQVRIVHGKGTGQMRNAVTEFIRHHHAVKDYRIGEQGEGGSGVTIATIRR